MTKSVSNVRSEFLSLRTFADVAKLLDVTENQLNYYLYLLTPKYTEFEIPKKSGETRTISAPNPRLKLLQSNLNHILQQIYEPKPSVHGFVIGEDIVENAKPHRKKKFVLNIDLKDFFPSIHFGRVRGLFMKAPYNLPKEPAIVLARICCSYDGLPQGAPTSPVISNMICQKMDGQLQRLALKHHCYYTRYADDITFSTSTPNFPSALAEFVEGQLRVGDELKRIIEDDNSFRVNERKVRLKTPNQRQEVTGLTVNKFANVSRHYVRQIRVMLQDWKVLGKDDAYRRHLSLHSTHRSPDRVVHPNFNDIVRGKIEFVGMVRGNDDPLYHKLLAKLAKLDSQFASKYRPPTKSYIFLNYAREDESHVEKLFELIKGWGYLPWMDRAEIKGGDEWEKKIYESIDKSIIFLACLSKKSIKKKDGFVQKEINYGLKLQHDGNKTNFVIPLLLESCSPADDLKKLDWINYFEKGGINRLREAIQEKIQNS
jgi:RNA-directed DNA polymerase